MIRVLLVYRKVTYKVRSIASLGLSNLGVLLTHGNLAIAAKSNLYGYPIDSERVTLLSYLPLAHIYEVCWQLNVRAFPFQSAATANYSIGSHYCRGSHRLLHGRSPSTARGCASPQTKFFSCSAPGFEPYISGRHGCGKRPWSEGRRIPTCSTDQAR